MKATATLLFLDEDGNEKEIPAVVFGVDIQDCIEQIEDTIQEIEETYDYDYVRVVTRRYQ